MDFVCRGLYYILSVTKGKKAVLFSAFSRLDMLKTKVHGADDQRMPSKTERTTNHAIKQYKRASKSVSVCHSYGPLHHSEGVYL